MVVGGLKEKMSLNGSKNKRIRWSDNLIPDCQTLMKPVLKSSEKSEVKISEIVEVLAKDLALTDEEQVELLPSGKQTIFVNRVHWAKTYLLKAGHSARLFCYYSAW